MIRPIKSATVSSSGVCERTPFAPTQSYAISKLEAELAIRDELNGSNKGRVIVRHSLVYGPGVPGNFSRLLRLVATGLPLPFRGLKNRRSFLAIQNHASMLEACLVHPFAGCEAFNLADPHPISTAQLVQSLALGMRKKVKLFPFPHRLTSCLPIGTRARRIHGQLFDDLHVDPSKIQEKLGWLPAISQETALELTARWYLASRMEEKG